MSAPWLSGPWAMHEPPGMLLFLYLQANAQHKTLSVTSTKLSQIGQCALSFLHVASTMYYAGYLVDCKASVLCGLAWESKLCRSPSICCCTFAKLTAQSPLLTSRLNPSSLPCSLPAAVITSSGTAVANLLPAVVEASQSNIPLLLLTADRPSEMRDSGANQTIDQVKIFGGYTRWAVDVPPPDPAVPVRALLTTTDACCPLCHWNSRWACSHQLPV